MGPPSPRGLSLSLSPEEDASIDPRVFLSLWSVLAAFRLFKDCVVAYTSVIEELEGLGEREKMAGAPRGRPIWLRALALFGDGPWM